MGRAHFSVRKSLSEPLKALPDTGVRGIAWSESKVYRSRLTFSTSSFDYRQHQKRCFSISNSTTDTSLPPPPSVNTFLTTTSDPPPQPPTSPLFPFQSPLSSSSTASQPPPTQPLSYRNASAAHCPPSTRRSRSLTPRPILLLLSLTGGTGRF